MKSEDEVRSALVWDDLELPPVEPAPPGFARRVAALAAAERPLLPGFALSPAWSGVAAALIVAVGVVGGAELGLRALPAEGSTGSGGSTAPDSAGADETLSASAADESFWSDDALLDERLFDDSAASVEPKKPSAGSAADGEGERR